MSKTKATSVMWKGPSNTPHVHEGKNSCYCKDDINEVYKKSGFAGYYVGEEFSNVTSQIEEYIYMVATDEDGNPFLGNGDIAARPCPPRCIGDGGGAKSSKTTPISKIDFSNTCKKEEC